MRYFKLVLDPSVYLGFRIPLSSRFQTMDCVSNLQVVAVNTILENGVGSCSNHMLNLSSQVRSFAGISSLFTNMSFIFKLCQQQNTRMLCFDRQ